MEPNPEVAASQKDNKSYHQILPQECHQYPILLNT